MRVSFKNLFKNSKITKLKIVFNRVSFKNLKIKNLKIIIPALIVVALVFFARNYSEATTQGSSLTAKPTNGNTLKNGLVGWWTMDGADTTVVTTTDKSGNGNDGTRTGTTNLLIGKIGQGIKFDGSSGYINAGSGLGNFSSTSPFTVAGWIIVRGSGLKAFTSRASVGGEGWYIYYDDTNAVCIGCFLWDFLGHNGNYDRITTGDGSVVKNKWYHFVISQDGTNTLAGRKIYINGVVRGNGGSRSGASAPDDPGYGGTTFQMGARGGASFANALMDDVRVYNRALSQSEITALYKFGQNKMASSQTAAPTNGNNLKNGLVGWWTMDGADVTSTAAIDKSTTGANGTRSGTTKNVGKIGQALKFNGTTDKVTVADKSALDLTTNFSVSAWAWIDPASTGYVVIYTSGTQLNFWELVFNGATPEVCEDNIVCTAAARAVTKGAWHQVVMVKTGDSGNNVQFFTDGVANGTIAIGTVSTPSGTKTIGVGGNQTTNFFNGKIDDLRIYNRALSSTEITALYKYGQSKMDSSQTAAPTTGNNLKTGLVGWWTMDGPDTTAVTTKDKSGSGNNGTLTAVTFVSGKVGQALNFNGSSGKVDVGNKSQLSFGTGNFSIATWVKPNGSNLSYSAIVSKYSVGFGYFITLNGFIPRIFLNDSVPAAGNYLWSDCGTTGLVNNKWSQFVVTFQRNGNAVCYINGVSTGVLDISTENGNLDNTEHFVIGEELPDTTYFKGGIDDVRVYNRVLSQAEVTELYRMGR